MNIVKTTVLMTGLLMLFMAAGSLMGGQQGMLMALILGGAMNLGAYWFSDKIVLSMSGAKPVGEGEAPELYRAVRALANNAGLPMPKVYIIPMPAPNAFATGRSPQHAAVAVSPSLMQALTPDELQGVLAHELAHIQNRDILIATVAACFAGAISYLAHMAQWAALFGGMGGRRDDEENHHPLAALAMMIVAPLAAMLIQMAISRSREYAADATAAKMTGKPLALANALKRIHEVAAARPVAVEPVTASLYIANPLRGRQLMSWFSTHPPVEKRVERLEALVRAQSGIHT